ncbi:putative Pyruvate dehydrogenase E1 component [Streptomyces afghaniensis 772]|uniref:Putative Pyruvate dehydrogenase E1 component n=1 Tax=Streptomyces afghaniensis 772 TaxID=1283301 RepID=S4MD04_9ACTN|nr:putative Pyruvate dehydrogenase E1 component [Streptomyces afghaniensis 772]
MDRRTGAEQLDPRGVGRGRDARRLRRVEAVQALDDALVDAVHGRLRGLRQRLVVDGQVVEDVLVLTRGRLAVHPAQTVLDDDRDLVRERRVVRQRRRVRRGDDGGVAVGVLEALTGQRRAARRGADEEAAAELVAELPHLVGRALPAEHRVEDVERDHRLAVRRVRRRGGDEVGHRTGLGDPLVEDLAVLGLLVVHQLVAVDRLVRLALGRVDAQGREEALHTEGARLVRDDRHPALAGLLVADQVLDQADERHRRRHVLRTRALVEGRERLLRRGGQRRDRVDAAGRGRTAEGGTPLLEVADLGGVGARVAVGDHAVDEVAVLDRQAEQVAHVLELVHRQLLHLVVGVLRREALAEGVALDRLGQDHRRRALVLDGRLVRGVHLAGLVTTAREVETLEDLVVAQQLRQLRQRRVGAEEVLADVGRVAGLVRLDLRVRYLAQTAYQRARGVELEQLVPGRAPQRLDDVPAGASELGLQLLHDLEVGADRAVEALQVAVDDEGEVVQLLTGRQRECRRRLGLVHLAVAEERPHVRGGGVLDAAVGEVAVEARLVDGGERAQTHGDGRELPQPGQAARVRVGGQAVAARLAAEVVELLLGQTAVEERAGVDAGGGVALDVELVAGAVGLFAFEEVVEAGLVEPGRGGEGGDVAADAVLAAPGDHRGRVPAVPRGDPLLHRLVTGHGRLGGGGDGVDVVGLQELRQRDAGALGTLQRAPHQVRGTVRPGRLGHRVQGGLPFGGLLRVPVRELVELARLDGVGVGHVAAFLSRRGFPHVRGSGVPFVFGRTGLELGWQARRRL